MMTKAAITSFTAILVASASLAMAAGTALAAGLTITPSSIPGNYTGTVTLDITGLASGQEVRVETFVDVNGNGAIDDGDMLVQSFTVADGQALSFGSQRDTLVPGDEDNTVDGKIRAVLYYPGAPFFSTTVAKYVYRVSPVSGSFTPVTKAFTVTQPSFPQKVKGTVRSGGSPVAGAIVFIFTPNSDGPTLISLTGSDGQFTLNADVGTYSVGALKDGFGFDFSTAPQVPVVAGQTVTQDVTLTATDSTISGRLTDVDSGVGLPGVEVEARFTDNTFTLVFTDTNGNFTLHVSTAATQWQIEANWHSLALLGYNAPANRTSVDISGGSPSGVSVQVRQITALIYGTLTNTQSQPVGPVSFEAWDNDDRYDNYGVADASGHYVVGAAAGTWQVGPSSRGLAALGYVATGANVTVSDGVAKRQDFVAQLPFYLSGQVTNDAGQPVGNICINAWPNQGGNGPDTTTDANGNFSLPVTSGSWNLQLCGSDAQQRGLVGPTLSFPNVTQDVPGIHYVALRATYQITGGVHDGNGNPIPGVNVYGNATINDINYNAQTNTGGNGTYVLPVVNGSWYVSLECNDLSARGLPCPNGRSVTISGQSQTLDFCVGCGPHLRGTVFDDSGDRIASIHIIASPQYGGTSSQALTDGSGNFDIALSSNTGTWNLQLNLAEAAQRNLVSPSVTENLNNNDINGILFVARGSNAQITGSVTDTNGNPVAGVGVSANVDVNGVSYSATATTAGNGTYQLPVFSGAGGAVAALTTNAATYAAAQISTNTTMPTVALTATPTMPPPTPTMGPPTPTMGPPTPTTLPLPQWTVGVSCSDLSARGFNCPGNRYTTVNNANVVVNFVVQAVLRVTTTSLPAATQGVAYNAQLQASGGQPPYTWSLGADTPFLPPVLSLNASSGSISGTPASGVLGTYNVHVWVTDHNWQTADASLTLTINPALTTPTVTGTPTPTKTPGPCIGDCNTDHTVTIDDIITLVNIALGNVSVSDCQAGDFNGDNQITVDEILKAVNNALNGC